MGLPQGSMYELPTCPVCLERMDSAVTGLITVPCSHTFHCMCLSKWGDSRYVESARVSQRSVVTFPFQMSSVQIFSDLTIVASHIGQFPLLRPHPFHKPIHTFAVPLRRLHFDHQSLDLPHLRQHRLRALRPCSRTRPLPGHDAPVRAGTRDPTCMGLRRGCVRPQADPEQGGREAGGASQRSVVYGDQRQYTGGRAPTGAC